MNTIKNAEIVTTANATFHYQEIVCVETELICVGALMSRLMRQIHLAFVETISVGGTNPIGVAFPKLVQAISRQESIDTGQTVRHAHIGDTIRLISKEHKLLANLDISARLARLQDYIEISDVRPLKRRVSKWASYSRYQPEPTSERLVRRRMKRHGVTEQEARSHFGSVEPNPVDLAYLDIESLSSSKRFRLYVSKDVVKELPNSSNESWAFSSYGLSKEIYQPEF
jgi:CRISPR-associated endonuclease Csy4